MKKEKTLSVAVLGLLFVSLLTGFVMVQFNGRGDTASATSEISVEVEEEVDEETEYKTVEDSGMEENKNSSLESVLLLSSLLSFVIIKEILIIVVDKNEE